MALSHIEPVSLLPQRVADHLREAIIRGQFKPGDRLKEVEIATQLGVSTIPVREAFAQLEREGLITAHPRRGKAVRQLNAQDLRDLCRLRAVLEAEAYAMIHKGGGLGQTARAELAGNLAEEGRAIRAGDLPRAVELDLAFHDAIYREAGSELLLEMWRILRARVNMVLVWRWHIEASPKVTNALTDHARILEALCGDDLAALQELAEQVNQRVSDQLVSGLSESTMIAR
ncbi:MAG: GntR family transcriptional regulator [Chloroflexi bacterium]|nr:GntR family transcriptional regulator [Chloroflexota bacterium]